MGNNVYMMTAADLQKLREGFIEDAVAAAEIIAERRAAEDPADLISRKAAAEVLGVHPETVNRRAKTGKFKEYKKGGTYYYSRREVEQFAK